MLYLYSIGKELNIPVSQVLAFFNKTIRKVASQLKELIENDISKELLAPKTLINLGMFMPLRSCFAILNISFSYTYLLKIRIVFDIDREESEKHG